MHFCRNRDDQEPTTNGDAQEPPEPKELTLEEWKALKGTREKPQYNIRKAGEGEDLTQYKNMVVLNKKSEPVKPSIEVKFGSSFYQLRSFIAYQTQNENFYRNVRLNSLLSLSGDWLGGEMPP